MLFLLKGLRKVCFVFSSLICSNLLTLANTTSSKKNNTDCRQAMRRFFLSVHHLDALGCEPQALHAVEQISRCCNQGGDPTARTYSVEQSWQKMRGMQYSGKSWSNFLQINREPSTKPQHAKSQLPPPGLTGEEQLSAVLCHRIIWVRRDR